MKQTEAWWVCSKCDKPIIKPGKKQVKIKMLDHRKICDPSAGFSIKQISQ